MSTIVNGLEITDETTLILKDWFHCPGDSNIELFIDWCNDIQDFICDVLIDFNTEIEENVTKESLRKIKQIKNELTRLNKTNPEPKEGGVL